MQEELYVIPEYLPCAKEGDLQQEVLLLLWCR